MCLGPFWIENWKTIQKIKIFDDYWFKKKMIGGWVGGFELYPNVILMFGFFLTLQHP